MPKKKYIVNLTPDEREELKELISSGEAKARKLTRPAFFSRLMKVGPIKLSVKPSMLGQPRLGVSGRGLWRKDWKPSIDANPGGGTSGSLTEMLKRI